MTETTTTDDVTRLAARVDELAAGLNRLAAEVEDLATAILPDPLDADDLSAHGLGPDDERLTPGEPSLPDGAAPLQPVFDTLEAWVTEYFTVTFARSIGGEIRWCAHWDQHAEAVTRLEALWRSWETLRLDPNLGIATWLTNYLDPQLAALLSRAGTFAQCSPDRHATSVALTSSVKASAPPR